jgi:hypothetical protein
MAICALSSCSAVTCLASRLWRSVKYELIYPGVLTERMIRLLQRHRGRAVDPEQHVEAPDPGYLLCQDTYFVGTIKGVGKIYMQSVVDAHCSLGFARLYRSKAPITAADTLHNAVLPFYEEHGVEVQHLLTDNGREYCGRGAASSFRAVPGNHPNQAPAHRSPLAADERLLRTIPSHHQGRVLHPGVSQEALHQR